MGYVKLNVAVLLFGLAGILAKFIDLPALAITFGRVFFSSLTLLLYSKTTGKSLKLHRKDYGLMVIGGIVLALHWWLFLESIKLSSVAIGTITFSAFPLFLTFLEPLVFHTRIQKKNIFVSLAIVLGVLVMVEDFSLISGITFAIGVGLASAFLYGVLSLVNKLLVDTYSGVTIGFYQHGFACVFLAPLMVSLDFAFDWQSIIFLVFLGVVTTAIGHVLYISSLKQVAIQKAGIISSLEAVYGIVLAIVLLQEIPTLRQIGGGVIIVAAVVLSQLKFPKRESDPRKIIE